MIISLIQGLVPIPRLQESQNYLHGYMLDLFFLICLGSYPLKGVFRIKSLKE